MRFQSSLSAFLVAGGVLASALSSGPTAQAQTTSAPPTATKPASLRVLMVGGGPDPSHNQAAIESNIRYVDRLLPAGTAKRVLFTDGKPETQNVLCLDQDNKSYYRAPQLPAQDGPTNLMSFQYNLDTLAPFDDTTNTPLLLYFTGHGSPTPKPDMDYKNNRYDMWGGEELTVDRLATELDALPATEPVTLIMVQCFSGDFSNLIFKGGNSEGDLTDRNLCGFFASVPNRTAAGCTPEINEANYHDFTGYFFAALSGIDRIGNKVTGADYNHDGHVGMNEAFAYTLIHDESIDTPVCTSDTFLRRFVKTPDDEVMATPYKQVVSWADPAQKAALEGLSRYLKLKGEDRLAQSHTWLANTRENPNAPTYVHTLRFIRLAKSVVLAHTLDMTGDPAIKARYAQLLRAEAGTPIPPYKGSRDVFLPAKPAT